MSGYPIILVNLQQGVVVVGGGRVAARKVEGLLEAGAAVTVVSPHLCPVLEALAAQGHITVRRRPYQYGDLAGASLAFACTADPQVNEAVWQEARARGCPVNVSDNPDHCTFHVPAVVRRGRVVVAIATGGASPALAAHLRREIAACIGPEYSILAQILAEFRPLVRARLPRGRRQAFWQELIKALLPLLRQEQAGAARQVAESLLQQYERL